MSYAKFWFTCEALAPNFQSYRASSKCCSHWGLTPSPSSRVLARILPQEYWRCNRRIHHFHWIYKSVGMLKYAGICVSVCVFFFLFWCVNVDLGATRSILNSKKVCKISAAMNKLLKREIQKEPGTILIQIRFLYNIAVNFCHQSWLPAKRLTLRAFSAVFWCLDIGMA